MEHNHLSDSPGWRSRGYIPHFEQPCLVQSITVRLYDAVPESLIEKWKIELSWKRKLPSKDPRCAALRKQIDTYEDAGHGSCLLRNDRIAGIIESSLLHFDGELYRLLGWCVMPNHVHSLLDLFEGHPLTEVLHSFKSFTAHEANKELHRSGRFWFREYYDRYIRNAEHLQAALEYVENNPVKANLIPHKELWRWSSAWKCRRRGSAGVSPATV